MDGNKDESDRCFAIAQRCVAAGNYEKAIKFLNKAERLYPSKKAQGMDILVRQEGYPKLSKPTNDLV